MRDTARKRDGGYRGGLFDCLHLLVDLGKEPVEKTMVVRRGNPGRQQRRGGNVLVVPEERVLVFANLDGCATELRGCKQVSHAVFLDLPS